MRYLGKVEVRRELSYTQSLNNIFKLAIIHHLKPFVRCAREKRASMHAYVNRLAVLQQTSLFSILCPRTFPLQSCNIKQFGRISGSFQITVGLSP